MTLGTHLRPDVVARRCCSSVLAPGAALRVLGRTRSTHVLAIAIRRRSPARPRRALYPGDAARLFAQLHKRARFRHARFLRQRCDFAFLNSSPDTEFDLRRARLDRSRSARCSVINRNATSLGPIRTASCPTPRSSTRHRRDAAHSTRASAIRQADSQKTRCCTASTPRRPPSGLPVLHLRRSLQSNRANMWLSMTQ
jgi:hypothetical protein